MIIAHLRKKLLYTMIFIFLTTLTPIYHSSASEMAISDAGSGNDAGDSFVTAFHLTVGTYSGDLTDNLDEDDFYSISASKGQVINIEMTPDPTSDFDLVLYDPDNSYCAQSTREEGFQESINSNPLIFP